MSPTLHTDRLSLRPIADADLPQVFAGLSHPDVIRYYGVSFQHLEATREQMRWYAAPEQHWFAVCDRTSGAFLGAAGLNDHDTRHRKAEFGCWLLPPHWGRAYMGEFSPALLDFGHQHLGLHRIEAFVDSRNTPCLKAFAKLPFVHEGCLRECERKDEAWISLEVFAHLVGDVP